ncbi:MAG: hypothetical protein ABSB22_12175 [Thermodesulfobacteriota bacterium]
MATGPYLQKGKKEFTATQWTITQSGHFLLFPLNPEQPYFTCSQSFRLFVGRVARRVRILFGESDLNVALSRQVSALPKPHYEEPPPVHLESRRLPCVAWHFSVQARPWPWINALSCGWDVAPHRR